MVPDPAQPPRTLLLLLKQLGAEGPDRRESARESAIAWLRNAMSGGPLPSAELVERARRAGISIYALHRARAALGVVAGPAGQREGWLCRLPEQAAELRDPQAHAPDRSPEP